VFCRYRGARHRAAPRPSSLSDHDGTRGPAGEPRPPGEARTINGHAAPSKSEKPGDNRQNRFLPAPPAATPGQPPATAARATARIAVDALRLSGQAALPGFLNAVRKDTS
jgi:hypothetical protein